VGVDARSLFAIPRGTRTSESIAMVDRGMTPMQALRVAAVTSADLVDGRTTWAVSLGRNHAAARSESLGFGTDGATLSDGSTRELSPAQKRKVRACRM
jgi:hypothetical protein